MPMPMKCSMNMIWNTQIADTCIIFEQWHISTTFGFVVSCLVVIALGVLYEYLRMLQSQVDVRIATSLKRKRNNGGNAATREPLETVPEEEDTGLLSGRSIRRAELVSVVPPGSRAFRAIMYGITVFLSFFLMLVFMTYNAYLILSVVLGAAIGHYVFNQHMNVDAVLNGSSPGKGVSCH
jgi:copper transporter 1